MATAKFMKMGFLIQGAGLKVFKTGVSTANAVLCLVDSRQKEPISVYTIDETFSSTVTVAADVWTTKAFSFPIKSDFPLDLNDFGCYFSVESVLINGLNRIQLELTDLKKGKQIFNLNIPVETNGVSFSKISITGKLKKHKLTDKYLAIPYETFRQIARKYTGI